ncbi:MAG TPA: hypothetical protein VMV41_08980 [Cellulomonadaceae bacterium]|nr:hypothetical protein [Cellulomonadaceae bacterium]
MTGVSGLGPWPGSDVHEAQVVVVGDLTSAPDGVEGIPFAVNPVDRGPWAGPLGRAAALLVDMPTDLGVHGWMLADRPGRDLDRARSAVREDLDALAVAAHQYSGRLVVPVVGPLTLATTLYLARGDRVLSDSGALRELGESLGAGIAAHVGRVQDLIPSAQVVVVLDEVDLVAALRGAVPSFSGRTTLRPVPAPVAAELLRGVVDAVRSASGTPSGIEVVVDVGAAWTTVGTVVSAGADGVVLAVERTDRRGWDRVAETVEGGVALWAAIPGRREARTRASATEGVEAQARVLGEPWREVGLPASGLAEVVLVTESSSRGTSAPGTDRARHELADLLDVARLMTEVAAG